MAAILLLVSIWLNLPEAFGAHPFWSGQVLFIGGMIGIIAASAFAVFAIDLKLIIPLAIFDSLFFFGAVAAYFGKSAFAASYAENSFAGSAWYFGWIALAAGLSGLIATAARYFLRNVEV